LICWFWRSFIEQPSPNTSQSALGFLQLFQRRTLQHHSEISIHLTVETLDGATGAYAARVFVEANSLPAGNEG
jgi:hypothetical protein